ncbi:hypothetical protein D9M68_904350 [compost metagenome]
MLSSSRNSVLRSVSCCWVSLESEKSPEGSRPLSRKVRALVMQALAPLRSMSVRIGMEPFFRLKASWASGEISRRASWVCASITAGSVPSGRTGK